MNIITIFARKAQGLPDDLSFLLISQIFRKKVFKPPKVCYTVSRNDYAPTEGAEKGILP